MSMANKAKVMPQAAVMVMRPPWSVEVIRGFGGVGAGVDDIANSPNPRGWGSA